MKKNKKISRLKKLIILLSIVLVVLIIAIIVILEKKQDSKEEISVITEQEVKDNTIKSLKSKSEVERMQIYLTQYMSYLENKEYEKAYSVLNQDFKNLYFPTIYHFTEYVEKNYFDVTRIEYTDIQRQGKYYILEVTLSDIFDELNLKCQSFVIYEKSWNEFELSFQAE